MSAIFDSSNIGTRPLPLMATCNFLVSIVSLTRVTRWNVHLNHFAYSTTISAWSKHNIQAYDATLTIMNHLKMLTQLPNRLGPWLSCLNLLCWKDTQTTWHVLYWQSKFCWSSTQRLLALSASEKKYKLKVTTTMRICSKITSL